ncbi:MAG: alpha-glucan family phosphorylase [Planctomycetaceae bacterium]|nr:alpha-glucan family phosphorylase [Planctomycetaceae bacterium]
MASKKSSAVKSKPARAARVKQAVKPASRRTVLPAPITPAEARTQLRELAMNLWWSWNEVARRPFAALDPVVWNATKHSPLATLAYAGEATLSAACEEPGFRLALADARAALAAEMSRETWWDREKRAANPKACIAYFCSEYATHESIQQYSGGLGVLAGDHLKSASDLGIPLVAVGLYYRHGYYIQQFAEDGSTKVLYPVYDRATLPISDTGHVIECPVGASTVRARILRMDVGRTRVFLLDADLPENAPEDRLLTEGLYKGEPHLRMRQQVLLGVGGMMALRTLGIEPTRIHLNEGHAAFAALEMLAEFRASGLSHQSAVLRVRAAGVFTTHTPVAAGHDRYGVDMVVAGLARTLAKGGISREELESLGREKPADVQEPICMTVLCLRLASRVNGVAKLHGEVSRDMWRGAYGVKKAKEVPIGHVTNGVHVGSWLDPRAAAFWKHECGIDAYASTPRNRAWRKAASADPAAFWAMRGMLRASVVRFARERLVRAATRRGDAPMAVEEFAGILDPNALTIGFARRFATYKRAPLVFTDVERLARIVGDEKRPVQFVFAGKAHPRDTGGQAYARKVFEMTRHPLLRGRVVLIEEYDMEVGRALVSGCDVWLNNPIRPHEASGTSGMKCPMHGGINCSILDGWWPEGFDGKNGWAIGDAKDAGFSEADAHGAGEARDLRDAESLYRLLEKQIVPDFYERGRDGLPKKWIRRALASASGIPDFFSTHRMVGDYAELYTG